MSGDVIRSPRSKLLLVCRLVRFWERVVVVWFTVGFIWGGKMGSR